MAPLQQCAVGARAVCPELGDVPVWERGQLARSRACTKFARLIKPSGKSAMRLPYLVGIAFPSTGPPDPIRGCAIRGFACRDTHKVLIDQRCCLRVVRMPL